MPPVGAAGPRTEEDEQVSLGHEHDLTGGATALQVAMRLRGGRQRVAMAHGGPDGPAAQGLEGALGHRGQDLAARGEVEEDGA